jgi:hypothetical protein
LANPIEARFGPLRRFTVSGSNRRGMARARLALIRASASVSRRRITFR